MDNAGWSVQQPRATPRGDRRGPKERFPCGTVNRIPAARGRSGRPAGHSGGPRTRSTADTRTTSENRRGQVSPDTWPLPLRGGGFQDGNGIEVHWSSPPRGRLRFGAATGTGVLAAGRGNGSPVYCIRRGGRTVQEFRGRFDYAAPKISCNKSRKVLRSIAGS